MMTNKEWLFSLKEKELAEMILYTIPYWSRSWSSSLGWLEQWLSEPHNDTISETKGDELDEKL